MRDRNQNEFTARDLLSVYFTMCGYVPDKKNWNEKALAKNPPRLIRLQRLKALFRAFGIPFDVEKFREGGFIGWESRVYDVFRERARPFLSKELGEDLAAKHLEPRPYALECVFSRLLEYRWRLERILSFNAGAYCSDGLGLFELEAVASMNRAIRPHLPIIDDLLTELISPTQAKFSLIELVKEYGYPDVDLDEIDMQWF